MKDKVVYPTLIHISIFQKKAQQIHTWKPLYLYVLLLLSSFGKDRMLITKIIKILTIYIDKFFINKNFISIFFNHKLFLFNELFFIS